MLAVFLGLFILHKKFKINCTLNIYKYLYKISFLCYNVISILIKFYLKEKEK